MNQQKQFQEEKLERRDTDVEAQSLFYLTVQWDFQQLCRAVIFNLSNSKMNGLQFPEFWELQSSHFKIAETEKHC